MSPDDEHLLDKWPETRVAVANMAANLEVSGCADAAAHLLLAVRLADEAVRRKTLDRLIGE